MLTFLIVAMRWRGFPRNFAVALYFYRIIGVAIFEVTGTRDILIFFPNLFEFWFVFVAGIKFFRFEEPAGVGKGPRPDQSRRFFGLVPFRYSASQLAAVIPVLLAIKLFQEYALHVGKWLDGFTAVEAVQAIWRFLTPPY